MRRFILKRVKVASRQGSERKPEMSKQDRLGWIVFGGNIVVVLGFIVSARLPQPYLTYCTADFGTCIKGEHKGSLWRVLDPPCPAGQSLRFLSGYRCHSIPVSGFVTPPSVCAAACAK